MEVISSPEAMGLWSKRQRQSGQTIALVPTMGFFHAGHLALMARAKGLAHQVVVSLFVNPLQFGPNEDLSRYPRDLQRDRQLAAEQGVDVLFAPTAAAMYPVGGKSKTKISVSELTADLCGRFRPGHFDGVCTVVAKLFHLVAPDLAVFGEKDWQQLVVIRQMVADLNLPVDIIGHPIVREQDGLAMSSRNIYLRPEERAVALCLPAAINSARDLVRAGECRPEAVQSHVEAELAGHAGLEVEYVAIRSGRDLTIPTVIDAESRLLLAARVGTTRLIDNGSLVSPGHAVAG